jgi:hypothetical protein
VRPDEILNQPVGMGSFNPLVQGFVGGTQPYTPTRPETNRWEMNSDNISGHTSVQGFVGAHGRAPLRIDGDGFRPYTGSKILYGYTAVRPYDPSFWQGSCPRSIKKGYPLGVIKGRGNPQG